MTWSELMRENGDQGYIQAGFRRVERALRVSYRDGFGVEPQDLAALQGQSGGSQIIRAVLA